MIKGEVIKGLRAIFNLSQAELGKAIGKGDTSISRAEKEKPGKVSESTFVAIEGAFKAIALNVDKDKFDEAFKGCAIPADRVAAVLGIDTDVFEYMVENAVFNTDTLNKVCALIGCNPESLMVKESVADATESKMTDWLYEQFCGIAKDLSLGHDEHGSLKTTMEQIRSGVRALADEVTDLTNDVEEIKKMLAATRKLTEKERAVLLVSDLFDESKDGLVHEKTALIQANMMGIARKDLLCAKDMLKIDVIKKNSISYWKMNK